MNLFIDIRCCSQSSETSLYKASSSLHASRENSKTSIILASRTFKADFLGFSKIIMFVNFSNPVPKTSFLSQMVFWHSTMSFQQKSKVDLTTIFLLFSYFFIEPICIFFPQSCQFQVFVFNSFFFYNGGGPFSPIAFMK